MKERNTKVLIRESIRRNRRKSRRKRSESFDYSLFMTPSRLDTSESEDEDSDISGGSGGNSNNNQDFLKSRGVAMRK